MRTGLGERFPFLPQLGLPDPRVNILPVKPSFCILKKQMVFLLLLLMMARIKILNYLSPLPTFKCEEPLYAD